MEKEVFEKTAGLVVLGIEKILGEDMTADQYVKVNAKALNFLNNK